MDEAFSSHHAIERVLRAEREARAAVAAARAEVAQIDERARGAARALTQRSERRIRLVADCFERDLAARLAQLEREAQALGHSAALGEAEISALDLAVMALACELIGLEP